MTNLPRLNRGHTEASNYPEDLLYIQLRNHTAYSLYDLEN